MTPATERSPSAAHSSQLQHFALVGMLEGAATNAAPRRPTASRLHTQPAPLIRLAGVERGLRSRAAGDRPRRAPERNAANPACLGVDRHRSIPPHAARILRLLPRPALADRGRAHPQPFCITAKRTSRIAPRRSPVRVRLAPFDESSLATASSCSRAVHREWGRPFPCYAAGLDVERGSPLIQAVLNANNGSVCAHNVRKRVRTTPCPLRAEGSSRA